MAVYPIMYILFDTGRLLDGIQDLRPYELPHHTEGGYTWHVFHRRHYTFTDSADDFRQALAWMRGDRQPPLYDGAEPEPNVFYFTLGDPRDDDSRVDFEFLDDHQMLLPVDARKRHVVAQISFNGSKNECFLSPFHPAWPIVRAVLAVTQPVHAHVTGDVFCTEDASLDLERIALGVEASTFIGPEQLAKLPDDAFAHFAVVERIGGGMWLTIPVPHPQGSQTVGAALCDRHWEAGRVLAQQLSDAAPTL